MIEITVESVDAFLKNNSLELSPSQPKICVPILKRIADRLQNGVRFNPIQVDGTLIIDGHHRYICYQMLQIEFEHTPSTRSHCATITPWNQVEVHSKDWDSTELKERYARKYDPKPVKKAQNL